MTDLWKVHALALATTTGVAYVLCAIFDLLFPPFGLLAAIAPSSPWPMTGSPIGFLIGFVTFTVAGFVLGALYGIAWEFWKQKVAVTAHAAIGGGVSSAISASMRARRHREGTGPSHHPS